MRIGRSWSAEKPNGIEGRLRRQARTLVNGDIRGDGRVHSGSHNLGAQIWIVGEHREQIRWKLRIACKHGHAYHTECRQIDNGAVVSLQSVGWADFGLQ